MSVKTIGKLVKASDKACQDQLQHLIIVLTEDGRIQINGSSNFVQAMNDNQELYRQLQTVLLDNKQTDGVN